MRALRILIAIFITGLFFACTKTEKSDWKFYADSDTVKVYYDSKNIKHTPEGFVQVWDKYVFIKKTPQREEIVKQTKVLNEIDCANKRSKLLSMTSYNTFGEVIENYTFDKSPSDWTDITPDSIFENLFNIVCPQKGAETQEN